MQTSNVADTDGTPPVPAPEEAFAAVPESTTLPHPLPDQPRGVVRDRRRAGSGPMAPIDPAATRVSDTVREVNPRRGWRFPTDPPRV